MCNVQKDFYNGNTRAQDEFTKTSQRDITGSQKQWKRMDRKISDEVEAEEEMVTWLIHTI